jgi:hypothetical protein
MESVESQGRPGFVLYFRVLNLEEVADTVAIGGKGVPIPLDLRSPLAASATHLSQGRVRRDEDNKGKERYKEE